MSDRERLWSFPNTEEAKTAFNARAKASMREFLRSKTWEEKVESIARMNEAKKIAREAMRRVRRVDYSDSSMSKFPKEPHREPDEMTDIANGRDTSRDDAPFER